MNEDREKILYIITKGNFGGAQRYVYDLATNLPRDKYEAVVACGHGNVLKEKLEQKNIRVIELVNSQRDISLKKDLQTFFEIIKIIRKEKPAVIHLNSSKIGALGALAGRILRVPKIIFTGHAWAFNEDRSFWQRATIFLIHTLTVWLSHQTIVVSKKVKRDIGFMPFVGDKIVVIYNGIKSFKLLTKKEARMTLTKTEAETPENSKKVVIASLSELTKNKGVDLALKAISMLSESERQKIIYSVAGQGEEMEPLKKMVVDLKLQDTIVFLGFVPDAKSTLSGANIFLLPSRTEAFPYVILEAGMAGLPIISTSVGGIPEVVQDMQNGILVHPKNPKEIAEAISYLLNHKDKQKEFGTEIKKTIESNFSMEKMLSETIAIYS